uniref:Small ribosomal subunit protein uS3c n=1 Tax=Ancoracysta twista TaxID=2044563 RepID=A0A2H4R8I2_9EUKA|nr:ribosomal protein S3 [Ancoracysta twista]ATY40953.1 ribosomal protein S3 [Ancoracysta twista]
MGQKVHPLAFRTTAQKPWGWKNIFYSKKKNYPDIFFETEKLRKFIESALYYRHQYVTTDIIISHLEKEIKIFIYLLENKSKNKQQKVPLNNHTLKALATELKNLTNKKVELIIKPKKQNSLKAKAIAYWITRDLENYTKVNTSLNRILKHVTALKKTSLTNLRGIKIQCSGRLNGIDRAKKLTVKRGNMPLQTFNATIDYCQYNAHTIHGVIGIKVWLCWKN